MVNDANVNSYVNDILEELSQERRVLLSQWRGGSRYRIRAFLMMRVWQCHFFCSFFSFLCCS